jgi:hypothetical protein
VALSIAALALVVGTAALAQGPHFTDVTGDLGIDWQRARSANYAAAQQMQQDSLTTPLDPNIIAFTPLMTHGMPGVAIFDVENDGDLDVFVTNGPGGDNALLINQLAQSGALGFVEDAAEAGVTTSAMDANGACTGDLDNDGDSDLLVLGRGEPNRLFENLGDGTFQEVAGSGIGPDGLNHISCSFGDIDGDGLLDLAVANLFDDASLEAIFIHPWALNQPNQLYRNDGGLTFTDISAASGILELDQVPVGNATITWAVSLVDVDLDGDTDIVWADDQGAIPTVHNNPAGGVDRGFVHIATNDGAGHFTDGALALTGFSPSSWMGLGFGDLDCDGQLDIFGSNFGDYHFAAMGMPYVLGEQATRHYLGLGAGQYQESVPTEGSAFGWGNAVFDADNDGDSDVLYHGGLDMTLLGLRDNPGVLLENRGCVPANPQLATTVAPFDARHAARNVRGVAIGDLDRDGFVDVVTAANWRAPQALPLLPSGATYGGVLDAHAGFVPLFVPTPQGMVWSGVELEPGDLKIERNDGVSGYSGITVHPVGGVGLTPGATVNRDGIGAVVSFQREDGPTALMPITAGASHLSTHAPEAYFGLGQSTDGTVEILWPGGVRNRVYGVAGGEVLTLPEIPCSIDADLAPNAYRACAWTALKTYRDAGVITPGEAGRLLASALRAYVSER